MNKEDRNNHIRTLLRSKRISEQATEFFVFLESQFIEGVPLNSKTKDLAKKYNKHDRTIRNYVNELKTNLIIRVVPHYKENKKENSYIEYNTYYLTPEAKTIIEQAEHYANRYEAVFFQSKQESLKF